MRSRVPRELGGSRRWGQAAAVVVFLGVCGLAGAWVFGQAGETSSVLVTRTGVPEGAVIERSDLVSREAAGVGDAYQVEQMDRVVGQVAAVDLVPGQVITRPAVNGSVVPGAGQTLVGLALPPSRIPDGLQRGDTVRMIVVPAEGAAGEALDEPAVLAEAATVYSVRGVVAQGGSQRLTVVVPDRAADAAAAHAAAGRVAVLETAPAAANTRSSGGGG